MIDNLSYVTLSGVTYPIKCDILVLEKIQEEFGDIVNFEYGLLGFVPEVDEKGNTVLDKKGLTVGSYKIPKIKHVNSALYWFVQEGLAIEGKPEITKEELLRSVDLPPGELGKLLHDELMRCFERKNEPTTQKEKGKANASR